MNRRYLLTSVLASCASITGCQPSNKELFELRSQCHTLAEREQEKRGLAGAIFTSHYDVAKNRCYVREVRVVVPTGYSEVNLMDAQSGMPLAILFQTLNKDGTVNVIQSMIGTTSVSSKEAGEYIDMMMGEDK